MFCFSVWWIEELKFEKEISLTWRFEDPRRVLQVKVTTLGTFSSRASFPERIRDLVEAFYCKLVNLHQFEGIIRTCKISTVKMIFPEFDDQPGQPSTHYEMLPETLWPAWRRTSLKVKINWAVLPWRVVYCSYCFYQSALQIWNKIQLRKDQEIILDDWYHA